MHATRRSSAAGHFEVLIDGHAPTAYVKSVEGGWARGQQGNSGKNPLEYPHITTASIEPIKLECGLMGSPDMLRWVQKSWRALPSQTRDGQISYADFDMKTVLEQHFSQAVLTETTFPTLDGASKDAGYLTVKMQPYESRAMMSSASTRISGTTNVLQKMWTPAAFRFTILGVDGMEYTNKIDSFTVKLGHKRTKYGCDPIPDTTPSSVQFPNITGTISMRYGEQLLKWYQHYVHHVPRPGTSDHDARKEAYLELLTPDRKQTLLTINMSEVAPLFVSVASAKANEESVRRLKFELYVRRMDIVGSPLLGFI